MHRYFVSPAPQDPLSINQLVGPGASIEPWRRLTSSSSKQFATMASGTSPPMHAYLLVDLLAFKILGAEPECRKGDGEILLKGYESYMIEQWACERRMNTVVSSYTGNQKDSVRVNVLYVPENRETWGPKVLRYFDDLSGMHLVPKETSMGRMFVTNLSSFPSNWNLIPMSLPFEESRERYIVNRNLRMLHCVGRHSINLDLPGDSAAIKFRQMMKIPAEIDVMFAAREAITLLQIALFYFGLFPASYVDGLFCDLTVAATQEWWSKFGMPRYKYSPTPSSNMYEATTIAAVIGFVIGTRSRFSQLGIRAHKDPFNADSFIQAIRQFQKSERLPKTQRLDEPTVWRLFEVTAKSSGGGQDLIAMFKSTMKEGLSGRPSSSALHSYETGQLDILALNVKGARAQYLWQNRGQQFVPQSHNDSAEGPIEFSPITGIPLSSLAQDEKSLRQQKQQSIVIRFRRRPLEGSLTPGTSPAVNRRAKPVLILDEASSDTELESESPELQNEARSIARKNSKPRITGSSRMMSQSRFLTQDDTALLHKRGPALRRTTSMSEVENVVLTWEFPVSVPKFVQLYRNARMLREQLVDQMYKDSRFCEDVSQKIADRSSALTAEQRNSDVIKFQVTASSRKEQMVKSQIHDLEAFTAKLDYEWSFLELKMRDVEACIDSFSSKVESIEERWFAVHGKQPETYWLKFKAALRLT